MMNYGRFTLDGSDAYDKYGVFVANDGYAALLSYPALKAIDENTWPELNGVDPDLMSPELDTRSFQIPFYSKTVNSIQDFYKDISEGAFHTFCFTELGGLSLPLRMVQQDNQTLFPHIGSFTLTFADDTPFVENYAYDKPDASTFLTPPQSGYQIDDLKLSDLGIYVLNAQDIYQMPTVKQNLLINNPTNNGATYDGKSVLFSKKELTLKCWARYTTPAAMIVALNAFVHDLLQTTEKTDTDGTVYNDALHELLLADTNEDYPFYYGQLTVTKFQILSNGTVWVEFDLKLELTAMDVDGEIYLLATEDGQFYIQTEDGQYYINLNKYVDKE
jgi:hypothetical protein